MHDAMTPPESAIRPEEAHDAPAIHAVHRAAFPTAAEARLVDRLRASGKARVSLVAQSGDLVVGHVLFTPVSIAGHPGCDSGLGLAPLAVLPDNQRRGIGSSLVREGLAACRELGCPFVVVLGHPAYYPRFGFQKASSLGLRNEYGVDEQFMVAIIDQGAFPPEGGLVQYASEFAAKGRRELG
jgi:putative acetyltransferase